MNPRVPVALLLSLSACRTPVPAKPTPAPPVELLQLQGATTRSTELATELCDAAGARFSGSPGEARGTAWALSTLKSLGFDHVHGEPVQVPHWVRGVESARLLTPFEQPLHLSGLGHTVSTPEQGVEGEVVEVESFDALAALTENSLSGKLLFVNIPMRRVNDGSGYGAIAKVRRLAGQAGLKAGAVGVLIRSVGTDHNRFGHTGSQGPDPAKVPAAALAIPDAELLHRTLQRGPARVSLLLRSKEEPPTESQNVVAELVGRERPSEVVLLSAHLDSWDQGTGALDDAAGVGAVVDALRLLSQLPRHPRRTVRVVLYTNEENGLAGGKAYGLAHADELKNIVLALESDAGTGAPRHVALLAKPAAHERFKSWAPWFVALSVPFNDEPAEGGADISVLRAAGVPMLDVRQDASTYFDFHHTANDTVDKLEPQNLATLSRTIASLAWLAAEEDVDFGRVDEAQRERKR